MDSKYTIGDYEFETREEWEDAIYDLTLIRDIVDKTDVHDPDEALRLYRRMRDGELYFRGSVGEAFFNDIADTVADISEKTLLKEREEIANKIEKNAEKIRRRKTRSQVIYLLVGAFCIVAAIASFLFYAYYEYSEMLKTRALEETSEKKSITEAVNWYLTRKEAGLLSNMFEPDSEETSAFGEGVYETEEKRKEILPEYTLLHDQYADIAGWLTIADTQIDLPVMQSDDNEFYLHANMDGEDDKNGTLFVDYRVDIENPSNYFIVYGHNMKSGAMFGGLKKFLDEDYARSHDTIVFDTLYEKQTFKIVAVCLSQVEYQDEGAFRYYDFTDATIKKDFKSFVKAMDEASVVRLQDDPKFGETLLTLSTCNSYTEDGRLYVVAVKVE